MNEFLEVITTNATEQEAQTIAESLIAKGLAGCVQVSGPIQSVYRWEGKVEQSQEWRCTVKTSGNLLSKVEEEIKRLHTYDCPQIVAVPILGGSADYLAWLKEQLAPNVTDL